MPYGYHITQDTDLQARLKRVIDHGVAANPMAPKIKSAAPELKKRFTLASGIEIGSHMAALQAAGTPLEDALLAFVEMMEEKHPELKQ